MSKSQIEGSIITIANTIFGREWRLPRPREEHDLNTLPSMKNLVNTEPYFEAMALSSIVEEMIVKTQLHQLNSQMMGLQ